jgi:hypothetical protein
MPCDSAAPGLIALGALIRDLGCDTATNVGGHYDALLRYARQYIESCLYCDARCHPELKHCGYSSEATGLLRHKGKKLFRIISTINVAGNQGLVLSIERGTWTVFRGAATDLQIDGEPPLRVANTAGVLPERVYTQIVEGAKVVTANLAESYSGLCFAGRIAGKAASHEVCASIRFRAHGVEYNLPELLTIQGWCTSKGVSRMGFFNARTGQFDGQACSPALVIADGDACLLRVLNRREFQRSDIIGVIHRTIDRDNLELIGNRMTDLRQWYSEDLETLGRTPAAPRGIGILILKRRAS